MELTGEQTTLLIAAFAFIIDFAVRIIAIIVVPRNRKPTAGMAWLLAIFFIPFIGILFFVLIGNPKLPKARRRKQAEVNRFLREATTGVEHVSDQDTWPDWFAGLVEMNRNLGAMPLVGANGASLHSDYRETLAAMAADIDRAEHFVHVESYILSIDPTTAPVFDALGRAVLRGVTVRVLLDHIASVRTADNKRTVAKLTELGIKWHFMLPVRPLRGEYQRPDLRNHRKIMVIDNSVGYMGSLNLIDPSYNKKSNIKRGLQWKELVARFDGPIVSGLNAVFLTDWFFETGEAMRTEALAGGQSLNRQNLDCQIVPSGPGFAGENNLKLFLALLYAAKEKIIITSPYFVPDEALMYAISGATQRGVHVELFVSEIGDQGLVYHAQRSYYEALLRAGVKIWFYKAPTILHSKHISIDDDVAVIGSSNMDIRSFELNMEVVMLVRGASFVSEMRAVEAAYRESSRELTLDEWLRQPLGATMLDNLARLTSALQ